VLLRLTYEDAMRLFYYLLFVFAVLGTGPAWADWHFCYAVTDLRHAVYFSKAFQSELSLNSIDSAFSNWLAQNKIDFNSANCPRADTEVAIKINIEAAKKFNTSEHRSVVDVAFAPAR